MEDLVLADIEYDLTDLLTLLDENSAAPDGLRNWLEYRAYLELVRFLVVRDELPAGVDDPGAMLSSGQDDEAALLRQLDQARARLGAIGGYRTSTERLFERLRDAGSPLFDRICNLYCDYKAQIDFANDLATAAFIAKGIAVDLWVGVPINTFIALLIKSGALDRLCNCRERLA